MGLLLKESDLKHSGNRTGYQDKFLFLEYIPQSSLLDKLCIRENIGCNNCQQLLIFLTLKDQTHGNLSLIRWQQSFCWIH